MSVEIKTRENANDPRFSAKDVPCVILTRHSTSEFVVVPLDEFEADRQRYVDLHLDPPAAPVPTAEEKIETLTAALAEAQKEVAGVRDALIAKAVITKGEIDAAKPAGMIEAEAVEG